MTLCVLLQKALNEKRINSKLYTLLRQFHENYQETLIKEGLPFDSQDAFFVTLFEKIEEQLLDPYSFPPFHKAMRTPFDYYRFGIEFIRSLVDMEKSKILHLENVKKIEKQLQAQDNVILFANHQTEVDPQLISIILEKPFPSLAEEMIFVAGDRVITDPLAIPFSKGRNLLCIYSKRHIDTPPEKKLEKQQHNRKTMHVLKELLSTGGRVIYVAPSGGRDRLNAQGKVEPAPFDPSSIEMIRLMASEASSTTHFYPLALSTYTILPPPPSVESEVGEVRAPKRDGVHFSFGNEIDMEHFPGSELQDRHARRAACALHIWNLVNSDYILLKKD